MRKRSSSIPGCLLLISVALILCIIGVAVAVILSGGTPAAPSQATGSALSPVDRAVLRGYLALRRASLGEPAGKPDALAEIVVLPGDSADEVIQQLAEAQIVEDSSLFRAYLRYNGLDTRIQAGRYALTGEMTMVEVAEALQLAIDPQGRLTVPEGWRVEQIANALPADGIGFTPKQFLQAASETARLEGTLGISGVGAEGFLFPDTYSLSAAVSADELVDTMVSNFDRRVPTELRAEFEAQGLTLLQAVVLASIVEREAIVPDERPLIASVFLNRLRQGMRLEADPTVQYAVGRQDSGEWWKAPLTQADLEVDSPYNTYLYAGLPPGPIANPGLGSLEAVARPADSAFLFFRAACDGSGRHLFASTFDEHQSNACP